MTRQELYDLVWSEAVAKVAERLHLSGNGLKKICESQGIPVPPRGYWAKIAAGQNVAKTRLPRSRNPNESVYLPKRSEAVKMAQTSPDSPAAKRQAEFEADPRNRIEIRENPRQLHSWARELRSELMKAQTGDGVRQSAVTGGGSIVLEVSAAIVDRAIGVIDALGVAASKRMFVVEELLQYSNPPRKQKVLRFVVDDVNFNVRLVEPTRRKELQRSRRGASSHLRDGNNSRQKDYAFEPTGALRLTLRATFTPPSAWKLEEKKEFRDKGAARIEDQLHNVMITAVAMKDGLHQRLRDIEERRRLDEIERRRQYELQLQREIEARRLQALEDLVDRHERAARLRAFIGAASRAGVVPGPAGAPTELEDWVEWALERANQLDPLA